MVCVMIGQQQKLSQEISAVMPNKEIKEFLNS